MIETAFTALVGCRYPLQQAGMGGVAGPELASAVSRAGALGMLARPGSPPDALRAAIDEVDAKPFGVTFLVPFLDPACVDVAAERAKVVEFFWGDPDPALIERAHAGGALASWQVGSLREAVAASGAGCDLVVVQGTEAGGHVRSTQGLLPLLADVLDEVEVPVLAAGGIARPRAVAACLAEGASGVRVGTAFIAATEADAHPGYVAALASASGADTVLTTAFDMMWPDAPHRVLKAALDAGPPSGRSPSPPTRTTAGDVAATALYAGEGVGAVGAVRPAAEIVEELMAGAAQVLSGVARWL